MKAPSPNIVAFPLSFSIQMKWVGGRMGDVGKYDPVLTHNMHTAMYFEFIINIFLIPGD